MSVGEAMVLGGLSTLLILGVAAAIIGLVSTIDSIQDDIAGLESKISFMRIDIDTWAKQVRELHEAVEKLRPSA